MLICHQSLGTENTQPSLPLSEEQPVIGSSSRNPILLRGVKTMDQIKDIQGEYIRKHYKGYHIVGDIFTTIEGNQFIQILVIKNEDKAEKFIYFDMTDVYKKIKRSADKKTRETIKELEALHQPKTTS